MRLVPGARTIDDAYITYRYARNLLSGLGLVYNTGQPVFGATTPLYVFLLAAVGFPLGGPQAPFPILSLVINTIADGISCMLLVRIGERLGFRRAGLAAALVWAIAPYSVTFAIGGMETSVFVALLLATFYLYLTDRPVIAGLTGSLSLLTRPDALLFLIPLGIERLRRLWLPRSSSDQRLPVRPAELVAFLLPLAAWSIYATVSLGTPIPRSMAAKALAYHLPANAGVIRLLQHYATPFMGNLAFGTWWIRLGVLLFPLMFALGALTALRKSGSSWALLGYPIVYFVAFAIANPLIFRWYLTPPLPIYFLGIFLGAERLARDLKRSHILTGFALLALALLINGWSLRPDHGPSRPAPKMAYIKLELLYQDAARIVQPRLGPDDLLASGDIGVLGYLTNARILDTVGLITPRAAEFYPLPDDRYVANYAIPPRLITQSQPDVLVILEVYGRRTLLQDPAFLSSYTLIETIPTDMYGSQGMLIYAREGS